MNFGSKTVKSLVLNNKTVKSITRVSDGAILYSAPNSLVLTSNKNIIQVGERLQLTAKYLSEDGVIEGRNILLSKIVDDTDFVLEVTSDKQIIQTGETCRLTVKVADVYDVGRENIIVNLFKIGESMKEYVGTVVTDSNGEATYDYTGTGVGDVIFCAESGSLVSETYVVEDCYKYTSDGSTLDGTFTVTDGYITDCQSNVGLSSFSLTGDFEFSFDYYHTSNSPYDVNSNCLWSIGTDNNNGVLIGTESSDRRIRIYNRYNGNNTVIQTQTSSFRVQEWTNCNITYINGLWKLEIGDKEVSYSKIFNPSFIRLFSNYPSMRLKEFKIKPL